MGVRILRPFELTSDVTNMLSHYARLYGAQILLLTVLSAITIYRRELSVNHTYVEGEETREDKKRMDDDKGMDERFNTDVADELLEGAGNTFSGQPLLALSLIWTYITTLLDLTVLTDETDSSWDDDCDHLLDQVGTFCSRSVVKRVLRSEEHEAPPSPPKRITWDDCSDNLLDCAGNFCSGSVWTHVFIKSLEVVTVSKRMDTCIDTVDTFTQGLPSDIQIQILSFLHPRDITEFSCASRSCRKLIESGETSTALWRNIWKRDYAWIVESWEVGKEALLRSSLPDNFQFTKAFYFEFCATFLNYILAGNNTTTSCLVGIHGDVYNLTAFLNTHPGSPDTLLVNSGRDATKYFEHMGHSLGARRLATKMCVMVDSACNVHLCGVHPTDSTPLTSNSGLENPLMIAGNTMPFMIQTRRRPFCLRFIRNRLDNEEQKLIKKVDRLYSSNAEVLNGVNLYYDPFHQKWKGWYTSTSFTTVFLESF